MAFSNEILEIRSLTRTNSTTFTDANLYRKANIVVKELITEITQATGHRNNFVNFSYGDLKKADGLSATDLGYNGEYPFPSDCIIPIRIEVKPLEDQLPVPIYDQSENTKSEWVENDLEGSLKMRFARNSIFIRPLPTQDVTGGIYWEYIALPDDLDEATDVPEFLSLFHDVITLGVAKRFFLGDITKYQSDFVALRTEYDNAIRKMVEFYQDRLPKNIRFTSNPDYQTNSFK